MGPETAVRVLLGNGADLGGALVFRFDQDGSGRPVLPPLVQRAAELPGSCGKALSKNR